MKTGESNEFGCQDDNKGGAVMDHNSSRTTPADALVIFGVTGDLAHKKIFPALYAMAKRGVLNVPVIGGSTGHAVGATLVAILLGPAAAVIAVSMAVVIQAVLFGDGGITALGANILNMAVIMPLVGWGV